MPQNHFFNISKTKYRGTIATSSANKQKHKIEQNSTQNNNQQKRAKLKKPKK